jgi:hypothetical protein
MLASPSEVLRATFRPATPLSQIGIGPEALRPSITAGLPFSNEADFLSFHRWKFLSQLLFLLFLLILFAYVVTKTALVTMNEIYSPALSEGKFIKFSKKQYKTCVLKFRIFLGSLFRYSRCAMAPHEVLHVVQQVSSSPVGQYGPVAL